MRKRDHPRSRYCPDCEMDWGYLLDVECEAIRYDRVNYCPDCGRGLEE